ncbi:hypothetical protein [Rhizobium halophytocola]|uniref:Uncharacterized protein n=1 Tax=Rhizobium halophytocola TaxID=735519 RepID=A0ABS4DY43_9HYPH|nr:hypothetical protein [Rhizobium halophytocola]MBP1850549.1 hypothetical protein [Rhizobium halophytocola]
MARTFRPQDHTASGASPARAPARRGVAWSLALALLLATTGHALADAIDALPITTIFVTSGGYWEDPDQAETAKAAGTPAPNASDAEASQAAQKPPHGYYKLVAIRQPDRTAKVYLQQIEVASNGELKMVASTPLNELAALNPYVTDIRPEDSTGVTTQPGFFATVYLKTDPAAKEPESWTVIVDEFGQVQVEPATN